MDNQYVVALDLANNGIAGTIPMAAFSGFSNLQQLSLASNQFT